MVLKSFHTLMYLSSRCTRSQYGALDKGNGRFQNGHRCIKYIEMGDDTFVASGKGPVDFQGDVATLSLYLHSHMNMYFTCFDAGGWAAERASSL